MLQALSQVHDGSAITNHNTRQNVAFNIDADRVADCRVQIIAWNIRSFVGVGFIGANSPAAWAGFFTGNAGTVTTGMNAIRVIDTQVSNTAAVNAASPPPPFGTATTWIGASVDPTTALTSVGPLILGQPNLSQNSAAALWIWSNRMIPRSNNMPVANWNYRSFVFDCAELVVVPATPDMSNDTPVVLPLDHFLCYDVKPEIDEKFEIRVKDQFGEGDIVLGRAVMLCNPSAKTHNGEEFKIFNEEDHLVCYEILDQSPVESAPDPVTTDQFLEQQLQLSMPDQRKLFCAPADKQPL